MKFATSTVSRYPSETSARIKENETRIKAFCKGLNELKRKEVAFWALPGGYLFARSQSHFKKLADEIVKEAKKRGIAIAVGIDLDEKTSKEDWTEEIKLGKLPWFAVCFTPKSKDYYIWRQRSNTSKNQRATPKEYCLEERVIEIGNKNIEILLCGEIFNKRIRDAAANRNPNAIFDLGHTSAGFRVHSAMKILAKKGIISFCSVHADLFNAMKYCYFPLKNEIGYKSYSTRERDIMITNESLTIEIKIWDNI